MIHDEFGTFISGSVPFRDSDGNIAGWVGVDYDASVLAGLDRQVLLALSLSLSTGLLLSILIGPRDPAAGSHDAVGMSAAVGIAWQQQILGPVVVR